MASFIRCIQTLFRVRTELKSKQHDMDSCEELRVLLKTLIVWIINVGLYGSGVQRITWISWRDNQNLFVFSTGMTSSTPVG